MFASFAALPPWVLLLVVAIYGAVVGSFLNVVIFRMPAGLSIAWPGSRCPKCGTPIRVVDNLPVVSWLRLRGRCRACREPISWRYPAVEALVLALFVALAWCEPLGAGSNLPGHDWTAATLWQVFANHSFLICCLLCVAVIEGDGFALPTRLAVVWISLAVALGIWYPHVHPVSPPLASLAERFVPWSATVGFLDGMAGLGVGATLGSMLAAATSYGPSRAAGSTTMALALAGTGTQLGWQAAAVIAAVTGILLVSIAMFRAGLPRLAALPNTAVLFAVTVAWLFLWQWVLERWPWLGFDADYHLLMAAGIVTVVSSTVVWLFRPPVRD